jgi:dTDP-4-amino-4,6-dideoxy-D-galactose acyltransferase
MTFRHPDRTSFYHPYNFLLSAADSKSIFLSSINDEAKADRNIVAKDDYGNTVYARQLDWDSQYFSKPIYRIDFVDLMSHVNIKQIEHLLITLFATINTTKQSAYMFTEIPSEDLEMLEVIGLGGWKLIETRLTYFHPDCSQFAEAEVDSVRNAGIEDIPMLEKTAAEAINHFDRFHSDSYFSSIDSDRFMRTFIANAVLGREDYTVVPNTGLANAFFAGSKVRVSESLSVGRMSLAAVSTERKGWHIKVSRGLLTCFHESGINTAVMTTQSTNRPVLANLSKMDFKFGRASHVFSKII